MNRRFALSPTKSPALTGGGERPATPCLGNSAPFDALYDPPRSHAARDILVRQVKDICSQCPIWEACYVENRNEPWVRMVAGLPPAKPVIVDPAQQERAKAKAQQHHDDRLADLCELISQGATLAEVLERVGVGRDALWRWCQRHGRLDLWKALTPVVEDVLPRPNRRKRRAVAA